MKSNLRLINIFLSAIWILFFTWKNGFGLEISWWVYIVATVLWVLYLHFKKVGFLILFVLFFLNLHINHLFNIHNFAFDFNIENYVLFKPEYIQLVAKYRYDDVFMPYRLRMIFYSNWLTIFFWIDSLFKILSPLFWSYVLGFTGLILFLLGIFSTNKKIIYWIITVCLSSSLSVLYDTKTAILLAVPAVIVVLSNGLDNKLVKKYWYILLLIIFIDLLSK